MKLSLVWLLLMSTLAACGPSTAIPTEPPPELSTATPHITPTPFPTSTSVPPSPAAGSATPAFQLDQDVTYCTVNGVPLKMDIYHLLGDPSTAKPVVIGIHGGSFQGGDKADIAAGHSTAMMKLGFSFISINYRLAPAYKFPAQIEDAKCAVRFVRSHAKDYNIDPDKIGVWGVSAGGYLAALLGLADQTAGWDVGEYLDQSSRVQAVVDVSGPVDLTRKFTDQGKGNLVRVFGTSDLSDPLLAAYSPVTYVTSDDPPFIIVHGDSDGTVYTEQSRILFAKLQSAGVSSELLIMLNADHGMAQVGSQPVSPSVPEMDRKIRQFFIKWLK